MAHTTILIFKKYVIYLAVSSLSCGLWDLHCSMQDLSFRCKDTLVTLVVGAQLLRGMWDLSSPTRNQI